MPLTDAALYSEVTDVIDKDIRPYIEADGGLISLKSVDEGIVYVQLAGACAGCPGAAMTLKGGVERILKIKLPDVREVRLAY
jgi:Fe-S cluster biogenesis protein NfuA